MVGVHKNDISMVLVLSAWTDFGELDLRKCVVNVEKEKCSNERGATFGMFMKFSDTLSFKIVLKQEWQKSQNNNFLDFWDYWSCHAWSWSWSCSLFEAMIRARLDVARNNEGERGEGRAQNSVRLNKSKDFEKMCLLALAISLNSVKINQVDSWNCHDEARYHSWLFCVLRTNYMGVGGGGER